MMRVSVDGQIVGEVISAWTGIPVGKMLKDEISTVLSLSSLLANRVIGQSHALEVISQRISTSRARQRSVTALGQIWDATGSPPRAGLNKWRPYETLGTSRQEATLETAACALDLIQGGKITAYGTLGHLLTGQPGQHVYEGDRPSPAQEAPAAIRDTPRRSWEQDRQDVDDWFQAARTDPAVARQILGVLTHYRRTREAFDRERRFMISYGIPGSFLPEWAHEQQPNGQRR